MLVAELAEGFARIEGTTSRQRVTALLADILRRGPEDADILLYLLQGRLGPPYAAPDLGMDERRIVQAVAAATGIAAAEVWRRYQRRGDLGLVAEELGQPAGRRVAIREVHEQLRRIAEAGGPGAYDARVRLLRDLLQRLGGRETRYLVRMVTGKLRPGVADATIMDALSVACVDALTLRPDIERAYSHCSDLGLVARTLLSGGPTALDGIHPTPGRPVLAALAERLPSAREGIRKLGRVIAESKYDGLRLQAHKDGDGVWLFTRRLENATAAFPEVGRAVREQVRARQAILDGEAIGYDPRTGRLLPFQHTVRRRRKHGVEAMEVRYPLRYYAFDLLYVDGRDLTPLPQRERSRRLRAVLRETADAPLRVTPQLETEDAAALERFVDRMVREGFEGTMLKRPDAPYHAGARRFNWVKLKRGYQKALADTFDVVVVGYYFGRGRRARLGIGALLCAVYDPAEGRFRTVTRVGSGLPDAEWARLRETLDVIRVPEKPRQVDSELVPDVWVEPRYVLEVLAGEITCSPRHTCGKAGAAPGYALRFPRIARLRFDRRPEDATTEAEVQRLYASGGPAGGRAA